MSQKKLLVVNDNVDMLQQIKRWLSAEGYGVETTETGHEGVALARDSKFDLILLDYNLKKEHTGEKTARTYIPQLHTVAPSTPIIVVSATENKISTNQLGVSEVLIVDSNFWSNLIHSIKERLNN